MAAQGTQDHRISIIQGGSSSRTHPVQPVSLSGMTRTLGGFGQCDHMCETPSKPAPEPSNGPKLPLCAIVLSKLRLYECYIEELRVRPVPDPAEKPQPFSAVGLLLTRTSQSLADMQTES